MEATPSVPPQTTGNAIASLVLGIVAVVAVPLIGVLALVFGYRARDELRRDPTLGGEPLATAGIVLGWVGVALSIVGLIILVLVLGVAF